MIAVQLTDPDFSLRPASLRSPSGRGPETEPARAMSVGETATIATQYQPLDPDIVSDAIPVFYVGRNKGGFWVAREAKGRIGGIFLFEQSALSFARTHSQPTGCATVFPSEGCELDLANDGNPFITHLGALLRLTALAWRRTAAVLAAFSEAVKRRLKDPRNF